MNASLDTDSVVPAAVEAANEAEPVSSGTPGLTLRQAREARGHSIADVVQVIRFSAHQIEALERDDYASLPGATSVRGLVRNYAKFLKLDATPLLAQLEPAVPVPEADVRPPANMGEAEQATIVERASPHILATLFGVLIVAVAGFTLLNLPADGVSTRMPQNPADISAPALRAPAESAASVPVAAPASTVATETTAAAIGGNAALSHDGLRVEFDDRSWIEIRDAGQKVMFVGEYPAGTRQNVEGKPPFHVWIGKASGVRLFMGERSIDLKPHTREEVARFTLE